MKNDVRKMRHRHLGQPYSRVEYIKRLPEGKEKSMKWTYGSERKDYQYTFKLKSIGEQLISVNALDSARTAINHALSKGSNDFFFRIIPYPHIYLREHGLLGVAKAERMAKGMKHSFGKPSTRVAHVHDNQDILIVRVNENMYDVAKKALETVKVKVSNKCKIDIPSRF